MIMEASELEFTGNRARLVLSPDGRKMLVTYDSVNGVWALMYMHRVKGEDMFEPVPNHEDGHLVWLSTNQMLDLMMSEAGLDTAEYRVECAKVLWEIRTSVPLEDEREGE